MKSILKTLILSLPAAALLTLSACSTVERATGEKTTSTSGKKRNHRDVLPQDRQQFILDKAAAAYTPDELGKGIIKGDWAIEEVNGKSTLGMEEPPYIKFDISTHRIYANNGCNYLNGDYKYSPSDKTIRFGELLGTMRMCDNVAVTDEEISRAIADVRYYSWELRDSQYYLYLENASHQRILTLMHQNFDFLNGTWLVKAIDDQPVAIPDLRFVIDVDEKKIHGNTGCNTLNGKLLSDMDAPNSISFQALTITRRACEDVEFENDLIVALEDAATAKPISPEKVLLINNHGIVVLELERAR